MASQDHRVERLESDLFAALSPADRVREVLKTLAEGKEDLALRISHLCPHPTYKISDPAYSERLRNVFLIGLLAIAPFEKYAYAVGQIEKVKTLLETDENLRAEESAYLALLFTAWRDGLERRLRAEWMGFDAFCRSELHLDAFTVLRGLKLGMTKNFFVSEAAREQTPTDASDDDDKEMRELAEKIEASWRESYRSLDESTAKRFKSGAAYGT